MEGIDQQVVGDKKTAVRAPRVHAESALSAHSREVLAIEHCEQQAKALVELSLPLLEYEGGARPRSSSHSFAAAARGR